MGAYVCDISSLSMIRISGGQSEHFVQTMYSGFVPALGDGTSVADGLFLNAQGQIVDAVQVLRMGEAEFLVLGSSENAEELFEWLEAHAELEDDEGRVFGDVELTDVSSLLALLVVYGPDADRVYDSIVQACEGVVAVMGYSFRDASPYWVAQPPAHVVVAPVNAAASIGEFLMADLEVEAIDFDEYTSVLESQGKFVRALYGAEYVKPADVSLEGLLRPDGGFVGARALGL